MVKRGEGEPGLRRSRGRKNGLRRLRLPDDRDVQHGGRTCVRPGPARGRLIWRPCANLWHGIANPAQALQRLKVKSPWLRARVTNDDPILLVSVGQANSGRASRPDPFNGVRAMTPVQVCSICGGPIVGFGNNARPVNDGICCDRCNERVVLPALLERIRDAEHKRQGNVGDESRLMSCPFAPTTVEGSQ
jgi:hypothetical protein